jgi:enamine deaminase RidA (YjgF/YER057c/UK114 family)
LVRWSLTICNGSFQGEAQQPQFAATEKDAEEKDAQTTYTQVPDALSCPGDLFQGDPGLQADQACRNIQKIMTEAGGDLNDVCKLTVYVTDIDHRPSVYDAINRWFAGVHHCSTGVVVLGLADPALLVEIDAMGVIDQQVLM